VKARVALALGLWSAWVAATAWAEEDWSAKKQTKGDATKKKSKKNTQPKPPAGGGALGPRGRGADSAPEAPPATGDGKREPTDRRQRDAVGPELAVEASQALAAPSSARRARRLAEVCVRALRLRDRERASALGQALAAEPAAGLDALVDTAEALVRADVPEPALRLFERAGPRAERSPLLRRAAVLGRADALLALGRDAEAAAFLEERLSALSAADRAEALERLVGAARRGGTLAALGGRLGKRSDSASEVARAAILEELGDVGAALVLLRRAAAHGDAGEEALARLLERLGRTGELVDVLERRAARSPTSPQPWLRLVDALLGPGGGPERLVRARKVLDRLMKVHPRDAAVLAAIIDREQQAGADRRRVEACYAQLIAAEPKEALHVVALGDFRFASGDRVGALEAWRRLLKLAASEIEGRRRLAEVLLEHDLLPEAREEVDRASALDPGAPGVLRVRAQLETKARRDGPALDAWRSLCRLRPDATEAERLGAREARRALVDVLERMAALGLESKRLDAQLQKEGPDLGAGLLWVEVLTRERKLEQAAGVLRKLAEQFPTVLEVARARAEALVALGKLDELVAVLEALAARDPQGATELCLRGMDAALDAGRKTDALALADRALGARPGDGALLVRIGDLRLRAGDTDGARKAFLKAIERGGAERMALVRLARLYRDLGRPADEAQALRDRISSGKPRQAADLAEVEEAAERLVVLCTELGTLESCVGWLERQPPAASGALRRVLIGAWEAAWRVQAREAALQGKRFSGPAGVPRAVLEGLGDRDVGLRARALAALRAGRLALPAAMAERALADPEVSVRQAAVVALARSTDARAPAQVAQLLTDGDRRVRLAAAWALGLLGTAQDPAIRTRLEALCMARDMMMAEAACAALGFSGAQGPSTVEALAQGLGAGSDRVRRAATWALGLLGGAEAARLVSARLGTEGPETRLVAAWALATSGSQAVADALARTAVFDPDPIVAAAALHGLGALKGAEPRPVVDREGWYALELTLPEVPVFGPYLTRHAAEWGLPQPARRDKAIAAAADTLAGVLLAAIKTGGAAQAAAERFFVEQCAGGPGKALELRVRKAL